MENIKKEIERRNKLFKGATRAEKRVLIAKDVINQIKARKFIAEESTFVYNKQIDEDYIQHEYHGVEKEDYSLREKFLNKNFKCNCCAKGALMVSCTLFNDKQKFSDYEDLFMSLGPSLKDKRKIFRNGFKQIFTNYQLDLIESAFECFNFTDHEKDQNADKAISFGSKYKNIQSRLVAIMQNIVNNNGIFKP